MIDTSDKQSENAWCAYLSDTTLEKCEALIGKTVKRIDASEYAFTITFTDGTTVETSGNRWGDCSMGVEIEIAPIDKD